MRYPKRQVSKATKRKLHQEKKKGTRNENIVSNHIPPVKNNQGKRNIFKSFIFVWHIKLSILFMPFASIFELFLHVFFMYDKQQSIVYYSRFPLLDFPCFLFSIFFVILQVSHLIWFPISRLNSLFKPEVLQFERSDQMIKNIITVVYNFFECSSF